MDDLGDGELTLWARALGYEIRHAAGCPGAAFPGIGLLIDATIPAPERRRKIANLLREIGASQRT